MCSYMVNNRTSPTRGGNKTTSKKFLTVISKEKTPHVYTSVVCFSFKVIILFSKDIKYDNKDFFFFLFVHQRILKTFITESTKI